MSYELWDFEAGNAIGEYERESDALEVVRTNVRAHGPSVVQGIGLLLVDGSGRSRLVAQGESLLALVGAPS